MHNVFRATAAWVGVAVLITVIDSYQRVGLYHAVQVLAAMLTLIVFIVLMTLQALFGKLDTY